LEIQKRQSGEGYTAFADMLGKTESAFRFSLQKGKKTSALLAENEEKLRFAMKESARALRAKEVRGVFAEGKPALYRFSLRFLEKREGVLSSRYLKEALSEEKCTGGYADAALSLLPSFLTLAAVTLYLEKKDERYLHSVLHRSDVDFTEIFFTFSKIEKILLSEAAGIYACVDIPTRYLYHARISRYAKDTNVSEEAAAKMTVARANAEDTHIGAVLPKRQEGEGPHLYPAKTHITTQAHSVSFCRAFLHKMPLLFERKDPPPQAQPKLPQKMTAL
jgi:hypothetical protein